MVGSQTAPTFVLVHGAWADGTSWHKVIDALAAMLTHKADFGERICLAA